MMREYAQKDKENNTRPELEIWDVGQIGAIRWLLQQELLERPIRIQFVMGAGTGMSSTPGTLFLCLEECRRLVSDFSWSVCVAGRDQFSIAAISLAIGGDVRVGLEDNLYCGYGRLSRSSAEQVDRIVRIARELGREIATPDEARQMLNLKGKNKVSL